MARKRWNAPGVGTTRGHSILKRRTYGVMASSLPGRRSAYDDDYTYETVQPRRYLDSGFEQDQIDSNINRNIYLSSAALDDTYDVARASRGRDRDLLSHATQAISSNSEPVKPRAAPMSYTSTRDYGYAPSTGYTPRVLPLGNIYSQYSGSLSPTYDRAVSSRFEGLKEKLRSLQAPKPVVDDDSSRRLYGGYISTAMISPYLSPRRSPVASGCETPIEHWGPVYDSRPTYTYGDDMSDTSSVSKGGSRKRRKPRVLGTKRRTGNYYQKLLKKRAKQPSRQSKYWPYYDPDSLNSSDLASLCSDTESGECSSYPRRVQATGGDEEGRTNYVIDTSSGRYPLNVDNLSPGTYIIKSTDTPSPSEYKPFLPRRRRYTFDDDDDDVDYSPVSRSVYVPRLSTIPVIPQVSGSYSGDSLNLHRRAVSDTVSFNTAVAAAAVRARSRLGGLNFGRRSPSSLVLSVSGEYNRPGEDGDTPMGFHYVSRPIPLRGPQYSAQFPASHAARSPSDDYFNTYLGSMQQLRENIRRRLEEGYKLLKDTDRRSYGYTKPFGRDTTPIVTVGDLRSTPRMSPIPRYSSIYSPYIQGRAIEAPEKTQRRPFLRPRRWPRPSDDTAGGIVVYPVPKHERTTSQRKDLPLAARSNVDLYDPQSGVSMSALERIDIGAALVSGSVDVVLPKKKPKSKYAADKMRYMRKSESQGEIFPTTTGLSASRPGARSESSEKIYRTEDGLSKPKNLLSWQYRLESRASPDDLLVYQPKQYVNMRERVRDAQEKMDKHRQLLDRYLPADLGAETTDVATQVLNKYADLESRNPSYYRSGGTGGGLPRADYQEAPISDTRRRIRRAICKGRDDPRYFH